MVEGNILKLQAIKKQTGVRLHAQILQQIRETIESEIWVPNEKLPTELELQKFFGVSRSTIRQALIELAKQGYIYRQAGKGTFVSPAKIEDRSHGNGNIIQQRYGKRTESLIIEINRITPQELDNTIHLDIEPDTYIIEYKRLLIKNKVPFGLTTIYVVLKGDKIPTKKDIEQFSVSNIIFTYGDVKVARIERSLEAVLATESEGKLLKVAAGNPLLLSKAIRYTDNGKRVSIAKTLYRGDRYKYKIIQNY